MFIWTVICLMFAVEAKSVPKNYGYDSNFDYSPSIIIDDTHSNLEYEYRTNEDVEYYPYEHVTDYFSPHLLPISANITDSDVIEFEEKYNEQDLAYGNSESVGVGSYNSNNSQNEILSIPFNVSGKVEKPESDLLNSKALALEKTLEFLNQSYNSDFQLNEQNLGNEPSIIQTKDVHAKKVNSDILRPTSSLNSSNTPADTNSESKALMKNVSKSIVEDMTENKTLFAPNLSVTSDDQHKLPKLNISHSFLDANDRSLTNSAVKEDSENVLDDHGKLSEPNSSDSFAKVSRTDEPSTSNASSKSRESENSLDFSQTVEEMIKSEEDKKLLKAGIDKLFDSQLRSFVFNPTASAQEKFQECKSSKNEIGHCRYVQHCLIPSVLSSVQVFMDNVCIIEGRYIGVCCPEFPVANVLVNWPDTENVNLANEDVHTPSDCGVGTTTRIVGGANADRKAWPWMVALLSTQKKFFCGGSLINNRYVLTAAHCTFNVPRNQIIARLGEYDFKDDQDPHDDYHVAEIKRHGQYTRWTLRNDIALLKLDRPATFTEFVKTLCLPLPGKDYEGESAVLVGWGHLHGGDGSASDKLQEASFSIVSNTQCAQTHGVLVPETLICSATSEKNKGGCNGDSGGPLMLLNGNNRWEVIGLVSWGRRGCNTRFPTVYTRVTQYLEWIKKHSE